MKKLLILGLAAIILVVGGAVAYKVFKPVYPPRMTVDELAGRLDDANLVVIDVRTDSSYAGSESTIPKAVRISPKNFSATVQTMDKQKEYVLFCA
jgi:3-mercaptopyruvate sulfurtransferase SseA